MINYATTREMVFRKRFCIKCGNLFEKNSKFNRTCEDCKEKSKLIAKEKMKRSKND